MRVENDVKKYKDSLKKAVQKIKELSNQLRQESTKSQIAIIGYSCRFPKGANNPEMYWNLLSKGYDAVTTIRPDRFNVDNYYSDVEGIPGKMTTKYAAYLDQDIKSFDNMHFEISAKEATSIDPQHRLLLEVSWEAMENAGLEIEKLKGSKTGVFIGIDSQEYMKTELFTGNVQTITPYSLMGASGHSAAGRIAYYYDFKGPAIVCNTACSSSLTALNAAVESLKNGQCDLAIVGGANLLITPEGFIGLSQFNALAPDGKCKTFDDSADGFVRGEGCGVLILKRMDDAKKDNNKIEALIKGSYVGQDGKSNGFYAPNGLSEQRVIKEAINISGLTVNDIDYIEAHGTGTSLGDFIEAQAVCEVFKNRREKIMIGSVKSNIGHLEAASGMASVIKVLLAMKHKKIPPSINFSNPNKNINWDKIKVVDKLTDWDKQDGRRRAGINAFGISGTLVHIVVEEPEEVENKIKSDKMSCNLLTLSAKSMNSLKGSLEEMRRYLSQENVSISNVAYSSNITRSSHRYRFAVVGEKKEEILNLIEDSLKKEELLVNNFEKVDDKKHKIGFLFTGQGSIYKNIAQQFIQNSKAFRETFELCENGFSSALGISIKNAIFNESEELLLSSKYSQPVIFSIEYCLTKIWDTLGIRADVVIGHSIGEYAAVCYSGLISLEDAIKMISERVKAIELANISGKMVGVLTSTENILQAIEESRCKNVSIAAINAPFNVTISGDSDEIEQVLAILHKTERAFVNDLKIANPFHSVLMEPYEEQYRVQLRDINYSSPKIPIISCVTGKLEQEDLLGSSEYWSKHLSKTVNFQAAVEEAKRQGVDIFIEIGGNATLTGLASQCNGNEAKYLPSLRNKTDNYRQLLQSVKALYLYGVPIDWIHFYETYNNERVILPSYFFQRKELWPASVEQPLIQENGADHCAEEKTMNNIIPVNNNLTRVSKELLYMIQQIAGLEENEIETDKELFSFGLDSLLLMTFGKQIVSKYGLDIPLNLFFTTLNTIDKIATYIYENCEEPVNEEPHEISKTVIEEYSNEVAVCRDNKAIKTPVENIADRKKSTYEMDILQNLFEKQFAILSEQNEIIRGITLEGRELGSGNYGKVQEKEQPTPPLENNYKVEAMTKPVKVNYFVPYKKIDLVEEEPINDLQLDYIKVIESKYVGLTKKSKDKTQKYRNVYSNARNAAGFRPLFKEMLYQIIAEKGKGSKFTDIDGNEIIDVTMGFGVNLFGHGPEFVKEALVDEINNGFPLGPMGRLPGEVANLISELTGVERVFFCNSGTEADMFAIRMARAITGKNLVVCFTGSYHGTYDGLLGLPAYTDSGTAFSIPMAPGITENSVKDLVLLKYNSKASLKYIEEHSEDIAAVLVETVQSRRPDQQPREFLYQLREITMEKGIALIFDEIITGFRISAGGAQEYFGIEADIVTYGKVVGGGMPIGIVSGKSKYLDSVDGGIWNFGDNSVPPCDDKRTYTAGTFCHHPMAMASAYAVLKYIKRNKDTMYPQLNGMTDAFARRTNEFFEQEGIPFRVVNFGSMFRITVAREFEIFYYGLLAKGIYIWEGRNCFLSTEHTAEDIDIIIDAIKLTIFEMKEAGFFGDPTDPYEGAKESSKEKLSHGIDAILTDEKNMPVSLIQERLYSQIMVSETDPFDITAAYFVNGTINIKKMEYVIRQIIMRHEILRTSIYLEDGILKQRIEENWNFEVKTLTQKEPGSINEYITKSMKRFDLSKGPLIEVLLIHTYDQRKLLVFHFHHIASDGMSMDIFAKEVVALYHNQKLPPLKKQYRDFVAWENAYLDSNEQKEDQLYWADKMSDVSYGVSLPHDFSKSNIHSYRGNTIVGTIDQKLLTSLKSIAQNNGVSIFMLLLSAVNVLFHKITGRNQISVTTPVTSRFDGGFEDCIGMFTNTIVLSSEISGTNRYVEFLQTVKNDCFEAYKHINYPYNLIIKNLKASGSNPFNIMFVYENTNARSIESGEFKLDKFEYIPPTQEFEITVELLEKNGIIEMLFRYRKDMYTEESIRALMDRYLMVLMQLVQNPQTNISNIELINEAEKEKILQEFNDTYSEYPKDKTIVEIFEEQVAKTPDNIAVVYEGMKVSYQELNEKVNQLAHILREKGVGRNTLVGILSERSLEMIIGIYGILKAGGAYVPMDSEYPAERIRYMIEDSSPKVILTCQTKIETEGEILDLCDQKVYANAPKDNPTRVNQPEDLSYVIYTSGTTGKPKGVMIEHRNVLRLVKGANYVELNERTKILQTGSLAFDASTFEIHGALLNGGELTLINTEELTDSKRLSTKLKECKINTIWLTSTLFNQMICSDSEMFDSVTNVMVGGEKLSEQHINQLVKRKTAKVINGYGPTENTTFTTTYRIEEVGENIPIGRPISNTRVYIMDGAQLCGIGMAGELCIAGDGLARGYLNQKELTKEKFIDNPYGEGKLYRSGDLVRWLEDGNIEYLGRIDEQVKIRGFRIELGEIECSLRKQEGISDAVVLAKADKSGDKALYAYITSKENLKLEDIRARLSVELPEYMIPKYWMQIDQIPVTRNGKIDKRALPEVQNVVRQTEAVPPRNETEKVLATIIEEILGTGQISMNDSFFHLGGDSIKAIRVVSKVREKGYEINVRTIMEQKIIEKIAKSMKNSKDEYVSQEMVTGQVVNTPILNHFYQKSMARPEHFNQYIMLEADSFDKEALIAALAQLVRHHDILRAVNNDSGLYINEIKKGDLFDYKEYEISEKEIDSKQYIEKIINEIQENIDLRKGPLMKTALFKCREKEHLLIILHHLVVDGVSWRILIEDLETGYHQYRNKEEITLPPKTASYQKWAEFLQEYATSRQLMQELTYWKEIESTISKGNVELTGKSDQSYTTFEFKLDDRQTEELIYQAGRAYGTEINDLLLTALIMAYKSATGNNQLSVLLEGHGRENIHKKILTDRTVGWFTSIYPIILNATENMRDTIIETKEMLRRVPNNGMGYGVLKYAGKFVEQGQNEVNTIFNYLGEIPTSSQTMFYGFKIGESVSKQNVMKEIEWNGLLSEGELEFKVSFDAGRYSSSMIALWVEEYQKILVGLIGHCMSCLSPTKTASDFQLYDMSEKTFRPIMDSYVPEDIYPLTSLQIGMTYLKMYENCEGEYFIQTSIKSIKEIDPDVLKKSLKLLSRKHEILRTRILYKQLMEPLQIILHDLEIESSFLEVDTLEELEVFKKSDIARGFDFETDSLLRITIVKVKGAETYIIWSIHHIIIDGWSNPICLADFLKIYEGLLSGKQEDSFYLDSESTMRFGDYVRYIKGLDQDAMLDYWGEYLLDYNGTAEIKPMGGGSGNSSMVMEANHSLDQKLFERLEEIGKKLNITINTIFEASLGILLQKYNRSQDVVFGKVVSGRNVDIPGIEQAVGIFINTIPQRIRTEKKMTCRELLLDIHQQSAKSTQYDCCGLADIQRLTRQGGDLIRVLFVFENYYVESGFGTGDIYNNYQYEASREQTNYDLTFMIIPDENLIFRLLYNPLKYTESQALRILKHWNLTLDWLTSHIDEEVEKLTLMTQEEEKQILYEFNNTKTEIPRDKSIADLFEEQAEKIPNQPAVVFENNTLTYAQLNEKANALAYRLRESGVNPGDYVAVLAERSLEVIVAIVSIIKIGGAYVPIDLSYPEERIEYILKDCCPSMILIYKAGIRQNTDIPVLDIEDSRVFEGEKKNHGISIDHSSLAYCIYTSGTTGKPKGVMIEHKSIIRLVKNVDYVDLNEDTVILQTGAISFDASTFEIWGALLNGGTLIMVKKEVLISTATLKETLRVNKVNTLWLTSTLFNQMISTDQNMFDSLKYLLIGGEKLSEKHVRQLTDRENNKVQLINGYGPTENTTFTTTYQIPKNFVNIPIGRPLNNTEIYIMNDKELCAVGIPGELCIAGLGLARGYLNQEALTAEKFIDNPYGEGKLYRSGDLARWLEDGTIEFLGRIDEQVKIRGFRIELAEIESIIKKQVDVTDAVVSVKADQSGDNALYAYVTSNKKLIISKIKKEIKKELPEYMIPTYWLQIDRIPVTKNGKADKKSLPAIQGTNQSKYANPRNQVEQILKESMEQVIQITPIGIYDRFYELGGDSIKVMKLIAALNERGYSISVKDILQRQTISEMSPFVKIVKERITPTYSEVTVPIGPLQRSAMENGIAKLDSYNLSVLLETDRKINTEVMQQAVFAVVTHHDMLRTIWKEGKQYLKDSQEQNLFGYIVKKTSLQNLYKETEKTHKSMCLSKGPLFMVTILKTTEQEYIHICVHQFIADCISMKIIVQDLLQAYYQLKTTQRISLDNEAPSYMEWVEWLNENRRKFREKEEYLYWKQVNERVGSLRQNTMQSVKKHQQRNVLSAKLADCRNLSNESLVCAVSMAVFALQERDEVALHIEAQERLGLFRDESIERTIGWFCNEYPIIVKSGGDFDKTLLAVKKEISNLRNNGMEYLLSCELMEEEKAEIYTPEISLRYLDVTSVLQDFWNEFRMVDGAIGHNLFKKNQNLSPICVSAFMKNEELIINVNYDETFYSTAEMNSFVDNLTEILKQASSERKPTNWGAIDSTTSIMEDARRQINHYDNNILINDAELKYSLGGMQNISFDFGIRELILNIPFYENLDIDRFRIVWNQILKSYDLLRSSIVISDDERSVITYPMREEDIPFVDISASSEEIKEEVNELLLKEIDCFTDEVQYCCDKLAHRVVLVKNSEFAYNLMFSASHLIFDGFSGSVLRQRVIDSYFNDVDNISLYSYKNYLDTLSADRVLGEEAEIIKNLRLKEYVEGVKAFNSKYGNGSFQSYVYKFEHDDFDRKLDDKAWMELSQRAYQSAQSFIFGSLDVPVLCIYMGRSYQDDQFFEHIGEFIDLIPLVITNDGSDSSWSRLSSVTQYVRENNISFTTMIYTKDFKMRFPEISKLLNQLDFSNMKLLVYNYLGVYKELNDSIISSRHRKPKAYISDVYVNENGFTMELFLLQDNKAEVKEYLDCIMRDLLKEWSK